MAKRTCSIDGCGLPHHSHGYCSFHNMRVTLGIAIDAPKRLRYQPGQQCSIDTCDRLAQANGLCKAHWRRQKKGADLFTPFRHRNGQCTIEGCDRKASGRNMCSLHYQRWRKNRPLDKPISPSIGDLIKCGGCDNTIIVSAPWKKWCNACFTESVKSGDRQHRARRKNATTGTPYTIATLRQRDGDKCHLCGKLIDFSLPGNDRMGPTVDHLIPLTLGGWDGANNVAMAHWLCNVKKSNKRADPPRLF